MSTLDRRTFIKGLLWFALGKVSKWEIVQFYENAEEEPEAIEPVTKAGPCDGCDTDEDYIVLGAGRILWHCDDGIWATYDNGATWEQKESMAAVFEDGRSLFGENEAYVNLLVQAELAKDGIVSFKDAQRRLNDERRRFNDERRWLTQLDWVLGLDRGATDEQELTNG